MAGGPAGDVDIALYVGDPCGLGAITAEGAGLPGAG